ncbi:hypothetical protein EVG20_g7146 [Dentipellis fragilis]|uniref:Peptidase S54 rhomboid domain-containing protein n=1 Tax=Dentipellis fragilis TaxID=205917 RepID=A0A4Y9YG48_9AGAM|nr:hypothetical protein EVG20_g7146 [Dentipellis fragilis]
MFCFARLRPSFPFPCRPHLQHAAPIHPHTRPFSFTSHRWLPRSSQSLKSPASQRGLPSFREQVARSTAVRSFSEYVKHPKVGRQIGTVLLLSGFVYYYAASKTNQITHRNERVQTGFSWPPQLTGMSSNVRLVSELQLKAELERGVKTLLDYISFAPKMMQSVVVDVYAFAANKYFHALDGERAAYWITGVNIAVWLAWQIPRLRPFMRVHFTHDPLSGKAYTMLTSTFSIALLSFSQTASLWMMHEQDRPEHLRQARDMYHFFAFFVSAGLYSSLLSHIVSTRILFPRIINQIVHNPHAKPTATPLSHWASSAKKATGTTVTASSKSATASVTASTAAAASSASGAAATEAAAVVPRILPSLGSSGAIYSAFILTAFAYPDGEVSLIFPPVGPFPMSYGAGGLVLLDCVGVLRGWKLFDHYAHLGGAAFGALYWTYGAEFWDWTRKHVWGETPKSNAGY